MSVTAEILTTPTADTAGTTLVFRTATKHYVFGSQAEGTQRALVQQGTRLLKAQDFFLTGKAEWKNTGGFVGLMLTLADSTSSSYDTAMETARLQRARGKNVELPTKPRFNIHGPPNLKHTLGTCRRFIFRKGIPIEASEFRDTPVSKNEDGNILPTWEDANLQVWALSVSPAGHQMDVQAEAELEARQKLFDAQFNTFGNHLAPDNETAEERELRYDRIRDVLLKCMFDSNWSFDTLVERHISEVEMPAAIFVRNPETHGYEPYFGPRPGGTEPLPDIRVFTRTPWPGATIKALPPTRPAPECVSYIVRTLPSRGVFDVQKAKALGVKPGPDFGKLTAGKSVQNSAGEWIKPEQVVGPDRPGQGIVMLEVPTPAYLEAIVQREELVSPHIMNGIGAIIWILGPGVAAHPNLKEFMNKLNNVQHIVSSLDVSPNRVGYDSVAGQATRLMQIDPTRYATPVYDNVTVPQPNLLHQGKRRKSMLPPQAIIADRGLSFILMPKFVAKLETKSPRFNAHRIKQQTEATILRLAEAAQQAVRADKPALQRWRQLLARPDTEVITLGTGSALPSKYRNVSATLVRVPGVGNYLLDSGENTLGQLARIFSVEELSDIIKNLRMIWISHLHADHHLGTASVIHAWYHLVHGGVPNPDPIDVSTLARDSNKYGLAVISHSGMLQWLNEYSSIEDFGYSRILPIEISPHSQGKASELNILDSFNETTERPTLIENDLYHQLFGFTDIQAAKVAHCHGAMAVSVTFPTSPSDPEGLKPLKFSYSGDCRPSDHFARIGVDTTVLIHEATFDDELRGDAIAKKHSTTSEALGIGARMNAKAVVLTHFSQRYQKIPVLQSVADGETEEPQADLIKTVQEANEDEDMEVDPATDNADNVDIHPAPAPSATDVPKVSSLKHQGSSTLHENERIIKIHSKDMKVAIAFDYMRVKIGEIAELENFNEALNELLVKDEEIPEDDGSTINANGKKTSGDEGGGKKKKQKEKDIEGAPKKQKSKRNN